MAIGPVPPTCVFVTASSSSEWYQHLKFRGSCLHLYSLLVGKNNLIHELGPEGRTVLHKGVEHGCVKLVKFILVNMFDDEGTCTCKEHGPDVARLTREQLLRQTCEDGLTAANIALVSGSRKMVLLLEWAIENDELGLERNLPVPNVNDDSINGNFDEFSENGIEERRMPRKVYECIDEVLANPQILADPETLADPERLARFLEQMEDLKDICKENVDFEFVPISHVFVHFMVTTEGMVSCHEWSVEKILEGIMRAISKRDREEGGNGSMVATLFKILDPQGRTILHAALDYHSDFSAAFPIKCMEQVEPAMSFEMRRECLNAKDGAGRTILHVFCTKYYGGYGRDHIYVGRNHIPWISEALDWDAVLSPPIQPNTLKRWVFPHWHAEYPMDEDPIHLAVLFNNFEVFDLISKNWDKDGALDYSGEPAYHFGPLQLAAFLGRTRFLETVLQGVQDKSTKSKTWGRDLGLGNKDRHYHPMIHCAALSAQVEAIQSILKFPMYDPIVQYNSYVSSVSGIAVSGTALHLLLQKTNVNHIVRRLQTIALLHVLPNSCSYAPLKEEFSKLHFDNHEPKDFSANEISCINLLLQAGIDIWTPHCVTNDRPNPGPMANDQARRWWYDKVVTEVVTQKTSINNASNATSVIATLVATASFIGPLQPPLGWAGDGYVHTSLISVRVYLVCNILSFYFSIASILMAVLPAIPMPKESLYDELFRSQRCLKTAALLLLVSIICILISFTSASIAVVSSERHDQQLVGACTALGWIVCLAVLVIYIIRLLRMLFHRNDRFRRWFAKNMGF